MEGDQKELQLLPSQKHSSLFPSASTSSSHMPKSQPFDPPSSRLNHRQSTVSDHHPHQPSLDLQLSISVMRPIQAPPICEFGERSCVEELKWQAAEQIRLAAMEKAYAERVRELTRREMELAQSEFAQARHMWQRAREEVEKAERLKERATRQLDSTCMEITCHSCRQSFKP